MVPLAGAGIPLGVIPQDEDILLRRKINAELATLRDLLTENHRLHDATTQSISEWFHQFDAAFRGRNDMQTLMREHIEKLQERLIDPIQGCLLDENALLGSDLRPYNSLTFGIHLASVRPSTLRYRSPKEPQNPALFYTSPHPVVRGAAAWLKSHEALSIPEEITRKYRELTEARSIPRIPQVPLPTEDNEPIRGVILARIEELRDEAQHLEDAARQLRRRIDERIQQGLAEARRHIAENGQRNQQAHAVLVQDDEEGVAEMRNEMRPLMQQIAEVRHQQQAIAERQEQIEELERQGERACAHLSVQLDNARKAKEAEKKGSSKGLGKGLLLAIGCTLATAGASNLFTGGKIAILPGNGAKISLTLPQ